MIKLGKRQESLYTKVVNFRERTCNWCSELRSLASVVTPDVGTSRGQDGVVAAVLSLDG